MSRLNSIKIDVTLRKTYDFSGSLTLGPSKPLLARRSQLDRFVTRPRGFPSASHSRPPFHG